MLELEVEAEGNVHEGACLVSISAAASRFLAPSPKVLEKTDTSDTFVDGSCMTSSGQGALNKNDMRHFQA